MLDQIAARQAVARQVAAWSAPAVGPSDRANGSRLLADQRQAHAAALDRLFPPRDEHHDE